MVRRWGKRGTYDVDVAHGGEEREDRGEVALVGGGQGGRRMGRALRLFFEVAGEAAEHR